MGGILGEKMVADLEVSKEAVESAISFYLKSLKKPALKLKTNKQKDLETLVIQKRNVLTMQL